MVKKITSIFLSVTFLIFCSCASIFSRSSYPVSINSSPSEAKIVITDAKGIEIYSGTTPATVKLKSNAGFFKRARYQVVFTKNGYDNKTAPIYFKTDGWYWVNLLIGGILGMLIIDPATGAMYKLETEFLNETLTSSTASLQKEELRVYELQNIPVAWTQHLVEICE